MVNGVLLLGSHCLLCGLPFEASDPASPVDLCPPCAAALPYIDRYCLQCGLPLPTIQYCGACQVDPPPFQRCIAPLRYEPPIAQLIARFKYDGRLAYGRLLSDELTRRLRREPDLGADAIAPVPLHWRRRWSRGFNQAEIIADELGRALRLPLCLGVLVRARATPAQQSLDAEQRRRNLRAAFAIRKNRGGMLEGRRIALVDDVVTTGATASEITRLLLNAGARSVQVWCLARTP